MSEENDVPRVDLDLKVEITNSARVAQVSGMFDVPDMAAAQVGYHFDVPLEGREWKIGLVVGPSGAGKSSVARAMFGEDVIEGYDWPGDRSIVDCFGADTSIHTITRTLSSVGFSSPPAWLKPFRVLSNGERFRVNLARAIIDPRPLVVIDEFSSVVDRVVARIGSHACARTVRGIPGKQLVAVTCHEDVLEWLQPDWVLEPHLGRFSWRSPQRRPATELVITRAHHSAWRLFKRHHYLTSSLSTAAVCFVAWLEGRPVAFDAWLPFVGKTRDGRTGRRGHRTVCLPDYQGLGIGNALFEFDASLWAGLNYNVFSCTGHPAELRNRLRSGKWKLTRKLGRTSADSGRGLTSYRKRQTHATRRNTASFRYVGPPMKPGLARQILASTVVV